MTVPIPRNTHIQLLWSAVADYHNMKQETHSKKVNEKKNYELTKINTPRFKEVKYSHNLNHSLLKTSKTSKMIDPS